MKTVAVFFGGQSTEHDVSIVTALVSVIKPLELTKEFRVVPVYITREGEWFSDERFKDISVFSSGKISNLLKQLKPVGVRIGGGMQLLLSRSLGKTKSVSVDVVFPAMHGTFGEDGTLMGLLELAGVPYVGCSMPASVLAMDKVLAKTVAADNGIPTPAFLHTSRSEAKHEPETIVSRCQAALKFPMFVKPAHLGSSIGITRVNNDIELANAIEVAAHYDEKIIIEEAVANLIEVTLPIIGNAEPRPALLERPLTAAEDFFDFDTKYLRGGKKGSQKSGSKNAQGYSELPAKLPDDLYKRAEGVGLAVYKALGCEGIARVDMLIDSTTEEVYFNEVNPLPGSLYAHNWRAAGIATVDLVRQLVDLAEERFAAKKSVITHFDTNYLQQF